MRLIDADAVLERIERDCDARCLYKDYKEPVRSKMCNCCELGDARMYVEDAPTVDAERHGHWIEVEIPHTSPYELKVYKCSECKHLTYDNRFALAGRYRYCPHCGASMDETERGENNEM